MVAGIGLELGCARSEARQAGEQEDLPGASASGPDRQVERSIPVQVGAGEGAAEVAMVRNRIGEDTEQDTGRTGVELDRGCVLTVPGNRYGEVRGAILVQVADSCQSMADVLTRQPGLGPDHLEVRSGDHLEVALARAVAPFSWCADCEVRDAVRIDVAEGGRGVAKEGTRAPAVHAPEEMSRGTRVEEDRARAAASGMTSDEEVSDSVLVQVRENGQRGSKKELILCSL